MLSIPLDNAILIHAVVASSLPPVAALGGPVPDSFLLAQLVEVAQPSWRENVVEARDAQAVRRVCFPFGVDDDLEVRLGVLRHVRQTGKPAVCRALVTVRNGDELDVGVRGGSVAQIEEGLLSDCSWSAGGLGKGSAMTYRDSRSASGRR